MPSSQRTAKTSNNFCGALGDLGGEHHGYFYIPQPQPQPPLPALGQAGPVAQLSQALDAADGARAEKEEKALRGLGAPHLGHLLATSFSVRARWSNAWPQLAQTYS